MRDPKIVLKQLSSLKENQRVTNIYCNLYNPEFYKIAYNNIYSKPSQMTPASDGSTIDGMSMERIEKLIQKLRNKTYQPIPLRRVQIPKKNGGKRNISIPSFEDKLVQEVVRMILEALWEPHFSEHSHGFRPKKCCHTALKYVQNKFQGTKWWIDADIKEYFDNINHVILLNTLKERIREQKFIHLINLFLKAGYIENWQYKNSYAGVPQGSIIGPILSNIYLDKFDKFMENMCKEFSQGKERKKNQMYVTLANRSYATKKRIKQGKNIEINREKYRIQKDEVRKFKLKNGVMDAYDPEYRRLSYIRYADDFIVGVVSSKVEVDNIINRIKNFLFENLKLNLKDEKTKIIHNSDKIKFLGYELSIARDNTNPSISGLVNLWLPYDVCKNFIIDNRFGKFVCDSKTGKPKLKGIHRSELINLEELEILKQYNSKIRGLYNYYKMASNVCKLNGFGQIVQDSFFRTLAAKYKTSCKKLYRNENYSCRKDGKTIVGITYKNKFYEYFDGPFTVVKDIKYEKDIDIIENTNKYFDRTGLIKRLEAKKCEQCGDTEGPFEVHHVKKLKDLKGKAPWEKLMIARRRKTLVLCQTCHKKLHAGKL